MIESEDRSHMIKTQEPLYILTKTTYVMFYYIGQMLNISSIHDVDLCPFWVKLAHWSRLPGSHHSPLLFCSTLHSLPIHGYIEDYNASLVATLTSISKSAENKYRKNNKVLIRVYSQPPGQNKLLEKGRNFSLFRSLIKMP